MEVFNISEENGLVLAVGAKWLVEKLHAISEIVKEQGNKNITETIYDIWVGFAKHAKWNKGLTRSPSNILDKRPLRNYGGKAREIGN